MIEFNMNEYVLVRLNDFGRQIHREQYEALMSGSPPGRFPYQAPKEDAEGWSRWQLWTLMQDFGPYISLGTLPPFDISIRFDEPTGNFVNATQVVENMVGDDGLEPPTSSV